MKKNAFFFLFFLSMTINGHAQLRQDVFNHLDVAFTAGSTGLGFDLSMPAGNYLRVRTGGTFMPSFEYKMRFSVGMVGDPKDPNPMPISKDRLDKVNELLDGFTGTPVSDHVDMMGSPTFHNFKFMLDVFPFKKKNWHATVGFYAGGEKVAKAYNTAEAMTSLFSVKMYNNMYWNNLNNEGFESDPATKAKFLEYGTMAMNIGYFKEDFYATQDMYWDHNVYADEENEDFERPLLHKKGDLRFAKGELAYQKGDPYLLLPNMNDCTVKVRALANKVRPYVGIGYNGALSRDKRSQLSFNLGAMMWGGVPRMLTHDGIDLARDLERLNGQVKKYIDIAQKLKVFPVIELRFSQRIF